MYRVSTLSTQLIAKISKMNRFTVLESQNRLSTTTFATLVKAPTKQQTANRSKNVAIATVITCVTNLERELVDFVVVDAKIQSHDVPRNWVLLHGALPLRRQWALSEALLPLQTRATPQ